MKNLPVSLSLPVWTAPVTEALPCGENLEYSPAYMALTAALQPQQEVQYGDFIDTPEGPNWGEIDRNCQQLLMQTKDITLLIIWLRSRTRLAGAAGLHEGLAALAHCLKTYLPHLHPVPTLDGEFDLHMRANALSQLTDPEGFLNDLRQVLLSVQSQRPLSVRDIELALMVPQQETALPADSVRQQIASLWQQQETHLCHLLSAALYFEEIRQWVQQNLPEMPVNLQDVQHIFKLMTDIVCTLPDNASAPTPAPAAVLQPVLPGNPVMIAEPAPVLAVSCASRQQAAASLRQIRQWFETNEPSSPVSVLLWQAEKLIGKRYYEIAQCIPSDVLERWENDIRQSA